jgi:quercetin dioxygenase-like cupin family protein
MHVFKADHAPRSEPDGHFGGLTVSDVVSRESGASFAVQLSYCPPGGGGETHSHADDAQLFLVIDGELAFDTDEGRFTLKREEGVLFAAGERHATLNESDAESVSVVITVPA